MNHTTKRTRCPRIEWPRQISCLSCLKWSGALFLFLVTCLLWGIGTGRLIASKEPMCPEYTDMPNHSNCSFNASSYLSSCQFEWLAGCTSLGLIQILSLIGVGILLYYLNRAAQECSLAYRPLYEITMLTNKSDTSNEDYIIAGLGECEFKARLRFMCASENPHSLCLPFNEKRSEEMGRVQCWRYTFPTHLGYLIRGLTCLLIGATVFFFLIYVCPAMGVLTFWMLGGPLLGLPCPVDTMNNMSAICHTPTLLTPACVGCFFYGILSTVLLSLFLSLLTWAIYRYDRRNDVPIYEIPTIV